MASRFKIVDKEYISELKDKEQKINENKKNSNERILQANFEEYENDVLDQRLSQF